MDIGGTFTDVALELNGRYITTKRLTTPAEPEKGFLASISQILAETGVREKDIGLIIHGTTLATNALIERKGARTALLTTEGQRDSLEMAYENRFDQYDIYADRPAPLVPRYLRWPVFERLDWQGEVLRPLDEGSVADLIPMIENQGIESLAIGFIHAYANPEHERRAAAIVRRALPDLPISLSSQVCPEIREYERLSTTCANAYVQPMMARYLMRLERSLAAMGFACPFLMMTSSGSLATLDTMIRYPIRLVESGPAGGAILASRLARECGLDRVVSLDMGGTTAKICLIDDAEPLLSRTFEVARAYRFLKGSGLPIKVPVIEMVEIGAGGGSIAHVESLGRMNVGPQSTGSDPGPACYDHGGSSPTVTDADLILGRIDPARFAGGTIGLSLKNAQDSIARDIGDPMRLDKTQAAYAISELVDENMANAARVHAIEWGKELSGRTMIAFGGSAPLHAARLAEKLGIDRVIIPKDAAVGSAIGFLSAPIAFEVVRSRYFRLDRFDCQTVNDLFEDMQREARGIVRLGAPTGELVESRTAYMRYVGQGHEVSVELPVRAFGESDTDSLRRSFEATYRALYNRFIPNADIEVLSWALTISAVAPEPKSLGEQTSLDSAPAPDGYRGVVDSSGAECPDTALYQRSDLAPGASIDGPALIVEDQTTTVVSSLFRAMVNRRGDLVLQRV